MSYPGNNAGLLAASGGLPVAVSGGGGGGGGGPPPPPTPPPPSRQRSRSAADAKKSRGAQCWPEVDGQADSQGQTTGAGKTQEHGIYS
jgi:hypothetical protein